MSAGILGGVSGGLDSVVNNQESTAASSTAFGEISTEEFVNILVAELTNQDPFEPNDSAAILEQLSSLRNIESDLSMQQSIESLVQQNALSSASSFIGQVVEGVTDTNQSVLGRVTGIQIQDGVAILQLEDGTSVSADRITDVSDPTGLDALSVRRLLENVIANDPDRLIGRAVAGTNPAGQSVAGLIAGVTQDGAQTFLELDTGQQLDVSRVDRFLVDF